ncbi:MAG: hypothetical protein A2X86_14085 [Bdellovibrionales bacterium GWA2_49_15]|nr:MAG: hypothetical protein A2X86_14085 [Bdellovibrionales bacterium GWA2_49_15]HAZ11528.1 hypothetical protein [Bdellovibrionales bacterium]
MYKIIVTLLISSLLSSAFAATSERFWKHVEKDLSKQSKAVSKNLRKLKIGELEVEYQSFRLRNKLGLKYNVPETLIETSGDTRSSYAYFAGAEYQENFKGSIREKILQFPSFADYLETTGEGKKAQACRFKRVALLTGGVTLMSLAIAGGIMTGMLVPNLLSGVAITIRPVTVVFLAFLGVGAPAGGTGLWHSSKLRCVGEGL